MALERGTLCLTDILTLLTDGDGPPHIIRCVLPGKQRELWDGWYGWLASHRGDDLFMLQMPKAAPQPT